MEFKIKELPEHDFSEFAKLANRYGGRKYSLSYYKKYYNKNPKLFVACYDKKQMIGCAWGTKNRKRVTLKNIGVEAKYWRKGIGSRILKFFESKAKSIGVKKIILGSAANRDQFYLSNGYTPTHLFAAMGRKSIHIPAINYNPRERAKLKKKLKVKEVIYLYEKKV